MATAVFFVSSKTTGWQESCLTWAKNGDAFRIRDLKKEHWSFCLSLCQTLKYQYKLSENDSVVLLEPVKPDSELQD